jgi:excinuclease ABC subunit A
VQADVKQSIVIRGARVHNLKNISLEIPRNRLVVITGVSGSGKSSLAFDTIYAEGQRRYVESLSSYARQFLERMDKPDVDVIEGISPAMAIEQKTQTRNPRSTVATATEVYDYLRLLFGRVGSTTCRQCGRLVTRDSVRSVQEALSREAETRPQDAPRGLKISVAFPLPTHSNETPAESLANLQKEGFFRLLLGDEVLDLSTGATPGEIDPRETLVLVDRLVFRPGEEDVRLADSVETAFASGNGRAIVVLADTGARLPFNQNFECSFCHIPYEEPDPRLFSFNNPFGACPDCQGFGRAVGIDMELVVPDRRRTLRQGAIQPWTTPKFRSWHHTLLRAAAQVKLRLDVPYDELSEDEQRLLMEGFRGFDGIRKFFHFVEKKSYKIYYRVLLSRYRGYTTCAICGGARLRAEALQVRVGGKNIGEVTRMAIADARRFVEDLRLSPMEEEIARRILDELRRRLGYLDQVGIGYLTLDRLSSTLSGGEAQRINLATSLGSSLVGAVYVLDEPSIGLHPRDNERLIGILKALRDLGNAVLVVEHDADMIRASDLVVDLGPRAGEHGGEVVFVGTPRAILEAPASLTGAYLTGSKTIPVPSPRRQGNGRFVEVRGATQHNLADIDVRFPLNSLVCVTGVSGSGKSTLVHEVLYAGIRHARGDSAAHPGACREITGIEHLSAVELVDQSPIGRTPRSNPVTYIQAFDGVRALFAGTQAAKVHGYKPGHFSFNVPGGRCGTCEGDGVIRVEMQFLADLFLPCEVCKGKRYRKEILEVRYRGKNIDDVLSMSVSEALEFFDQEASGRRVAQRLRVLRDVGLEYVRLGQPATTLSGGEAQRIKLAAHLSQPRHNEHTLFIFDEPTTGLHFDDIARLMRCFDALIDTGNSVVIIEHNLDVIKCADHVIDLGPEGGEQGGRVVAVGTPEELVLAEASYTGRALKPYLTARAT